MDEKNNPTAQKFDEMMRQADADRKQGITEALKEVSSGTVETKHTKGRRRKSTKDLPATKQALAKLRKSKDKVLDTLSEEKVTAMQKKLAEARARFTSDHGSQTTSDATAKSQIPAPPQAAQPTQPTVKPAPTPEPTTVTATRQTVNMELAQSGNDISVASIAKLANRPPQVEQTGPNEVTISLH
jgi:hypothetical protein